MSIDRSSRIAMLHAHKDMRVDTEACKEKQDLVFLFNN